MSGKVFSFFFARGQEIKQQSAETGIMENARHILVPRTVTAAAAAVSEKNDAVANDDQFAAKPLRPDGDSDFIAMNLGGHIKTILL